MFQPEIFFFIPENLNQIFNTTDDVIKQFLNFTEIEEVWEMYNYY